MAQLRPAPSAAAGGSPGPALHLLWVQAHARRLLRSESGHRPAEVEERGKLLRLRGGVSDRRVLAKPDCFSLAFLERVQSEWFPLARLSIACRRTRRGDALEGLQPLDEVACRNEVVAMAKKRACNSQWRSNGWPRSIAVGPGRFSGRSADWIPRCVSTILTVVRHGELLPAAALYRGGHRTSA